MWGDANRLEGMVSRNDTIENLCQRMSSHNISDLEAPYMQFYISRELVRIAWKIEIARPLGVRSGLSNRHDRRWYWRLQATGQDSKRHISQRSTHAMIVHSLVTEPEWMKPARRDAILICSWGVWTTSHHLLYFSYWSSQWNMSHLIKLKKPGSMSREVYRYVPLAVHHTKCKIWAPVLLLKFKLQAWECIQNNCACSMAFLTIRRASASPTCEEIWQSLKAKLTSIYYANLISQEAQLFTHFVLIF